MDGSIKHTGANLTIGAHGKIKADIVGRKVIVQGEVRGDIRASESVSVEMSANVQGNLFAPRVGIKDGAKFRGSIDMDAAPAQATARSPEASANAAAKSNNKAKRRSGRELGDPSVDALLAHLDGGKTLADWEGDLPPELDPLTTKPLLAVENVFVLPGIPEIFQRKLAILRVHLAYAAAPFVSRAVYTRMDEAILKPLLDAVVSRNPEVEVGSYPRWNDPKYDTKITFDGKKPEAVDRALEDFLSLLPPGEPQWTE